MDRVIKQKCFNNQAEGQDSPPAVLCECNNKRASHGTNSNRKYELALPCNLKGFPCSSVGKESACRARDWSLNPGTGRSPGEGIGATHSSILGLPCGSAGNESASNTQVQFLGWENFLEEGKVTHSSILTCRIPWTV